MRASRRDFVGAIGTGAAALTLGARGALAAPAAPTAAARAKDDGPVLLIGDDIAVASTEHGKVRGYTLRGIHHFLGIPYGADTSGANRFLPPQKPKPWTSVLPAVWWGNSAPQNMDNRYAFAYASFRDHWNYDDVSEDCLRINVFTPALGDGKKRPVLFWIHGGGFVNGNGIEQDGYNGENLARLGRRGVLLDQPPPRPARLLRPGRRGRRAVRRVGQRRHDRHRAGARVGPRQHPGLRRRPRQRDDHGPVGRGSEGVHARRDAVGQGPVPQGRGPERGRAAHGREGRVARSSARTCSKRPGSRPRRSTSCSTCRGGTTSPSPARAQQRLGRELGPGGGLRRGFNPVVDGVVLPQDPYYPTAAPAGADVPMLICSTFNEQSPSWVDASARERHARRGRREGQAARGVRSRLRRPREGGGRLVCEGVSRQAADRDLVAGQQQPPEHGGAGRRQVEAAGPGLRGLVRVAAADVRQADARVPLPRHLLLVPQHRPDADPYRRRCAPAERSRRRWPARSLRFMRSGDPSGAGLAWPRYASAKGETMVLDDVCEVRNDPDREARKALPAVG